MVRLQWCDFNGATSTVLSAHLGLRFNRKVHWAGGNDFRCRTSSETAIRMRMCHDQKRNERKETWVEKALAKIDPSSSCIFDVEIV